MRQIVAENALTVDTVWNTLEGVCSDWWLDRSLKTPGGYAIGTDSMVIVMSDKATAGVRSMVSFVLPSCKVMLIKPPFEVSLFYCSARNEPVFHSGSFLFGQSVLSVCQEFRPQKFATTAPGPEK
jgi:hypothetical protein